jgi:predicted DCC family thiol-disulfide oxidoreductase YuxK
MDIVRQKKRINLIRGKTKEGLSEEAVWDSLLESYGFNMDDFGQSLYSGIENGYFELDTVTGTAKRLQERIYEGWRQNRFNEAWRIYHDSFDDNEDKFVEELSSSFLDVIDSTHILNIDATIIILKELGHVERAKELLSMYIKTVTERNYPRFLDHTYDDQLVDPDVRAVIREVKAQSVSALDAVGILRKIANNEGWDGAEIRVLSNTSPVEVK